MYVYEMPMLVIKLLYKFIIYLIIIIYDLN